MVGECRITHTCLGQHNDNRFGSQFAVTAKYRVTVEVDACKVVHGDWLRSAPPVRLCAHIYGSEALGLYMAVCPPGVVNKETTTRVIKLSGIETMPGLLNGTGASAGFSP